MRSAACGLRHMLAALAVSVLVWLPAAGAGAAEKSQFSRAEISWATTWINNALPQFMQKGIIAKISTKGDGFEVFAGKPWYGLSFTQQGEFLKNLSRSREIIGHTPEFSVVDIDSSEILARVSWQNIKILIPAEGFRAYPPPEPDSLQLPFTDP